MKAPLEITLKNVGERRCIVSTDQNQRSFGNVCQVVDAKSPLLSILEAADMGFECLLGGQGGFLLDTFTGDTVPIIRKGNLYLVELCCNDQTAVFGVQE